MFMRSLLIAQAYVVTFESVIEVAYHSCSPPVDARSVTKLGVLAAFHDAGSKLRVPLCLCMSLILTYEAQKGS
jgi:hypothetical protein